MKHTTWQPSHTRLNLIFPGEAPLQQSFKTNTHSETDSSILIPDNERAPRGEVGVVLEFRLGRKVSWQGDSRAMEEQGDVVGEQLGGFGGEDDGEKLAIAVDLATQEFL